MPAPFERSAPHFDGQPRSLKRFLEEIEIRGKECHLSSKEHITYALLCLDSLDEEIWRGPAFAAAGNWTSFKAKIISLYPGSDENRYTATRLEILVENQAAIPMTDILQFGEYHRQFITKANALLASGEISQRQCSKLFLAGLHIHFRNEVQIQLRLTDPMHPLSQPWTITQIEEAAKFLLEGNLGQAPLAPPILAPRHPQLPQPAPVASAREAFDMTAMQQFLASASALLNELNAKLEQMKTVASSMQLETRSANRPYFPQSVCRACSDPNHFIRFCPKVTDYIRRGRCIKDQTNRICLPSGVLVTPHSAPGKDILERVDNWHQAHPRSNSTIAASIVQVEESESFQQIQRARPSWWRDGNRAD